MSASCLLDLARHKGVTIATAESCTGGLIVGALTDVPGSSDVVDRGFVTYSNAAKTEMLGVDPDLIARHGAVSEPVAAAMAHGAIQHSTAQLAVSVTGIAGPGGSDHKPEGMVCFGIAFGTDVATETVFFGARGRHFVRDATVRHALGCLMRALRG
ncbi:MAG: CinA family protein [Pseudomonadota bacterium]